MLQLLHIENIAVIERADISFRAGFNALTGETGAGKSIVIDSLGAVLGARTSRDLIRTGEVSAAASAISKWPAVRRRMVAAQREIAATADMLIDGRDIGTRVLIDAPVKIFLTATPEERARRRYRQQIEKGDSRASSRAKPAAESAPRRTGGDDLDRLERILKNIGG